MLRLSSLSLIYSINQPVIDYQLETVKKEKELKYSTNRIIYLMKLKTRQQMEVCKTKAVNNRNMLCIFSIP
jgi:hypothetical protein